MQAGYKLRDRLLRPSRVIVSVAGSAGTPTEIQEQRDKAAGEAD
jgi:hypothetical protein